jgi:hypothetical protein
MKIKQIVIVSLAVSLAVAVMSCGSAPPPPAAAVPETAAPPSPAAEPAPVSPGPDQASLDALDKAAARAAEARKRASDFEGPSYFPGEWEAAEAQYAEAGSLPKTTGAEAVAAATAFNGAADAYDGLFSRTIPLYEQAREDEITGVRDGLLASGMAGEIADYLRKADESALSALSQYEAEDYYSARDTAAGALGMYETLRLAVDALRTRQEIVDRNFAAGDTENFALADRASLAAADAYTGGDTAGARKGAEEALRRYTGVLAAGWAAYAAELGEAARQARQRALELKANVAVKDIFNEADDLYKQAALALDSGEYEGAVDLYTESEGWFVLAGQSAAEKRRIAEEAIREAERTIEASDETARQAEIIIQGGSI